MTAKVIRFLDGRRSLRRLPGLPSTDLASNLDSTMVARKVVQLEIVKLPTAELVKLTLPDSLEGSLGNLVLSGVVEYCRIGRKVTTICMERGRAALLLELLNRPEDT